MAPRNLHSRSIHSAASHKLSAGRKPCVHSAWLLLRYDMAKKKPGTDDEREERIVMEIIVDAYGPEEQAMGW